MTLPLAGHPVGAPNAASAMDPADLIESAYRYLLADLMPFGRNARIQLEHGGTDESTEHYQTVTYWYGSPNACLVPTDTFHVGDPADEALHAYDSPAASTVDSLTSRYELGVQSPLSSDTGRHTTTQSSFTMTIDPTNVGVMLRRKLDYSFPNQRAEVYVGDDATGATLEHAGTWYLAGSNSCVFSAPPGELSPPLHTIETSDRRWREDEFLIPPRLTAGRSHIRIQIRFVPSGLPLVPGQPVAPEAWSEFRYWAYSYVMPPAPVAGR
jgi:hypothetical protein